MSPSPPESVPALVKSLLRPLAVRGSIAAARLSRRFRGRPAALPAAPTISIVGLLETASGLGVAARGMQLALADRSPRLVSISELSRTPRIPHAAPDLATPRSPAACASDVAIHVYNPDIFLAAVRRFGIGFLTAARLNVALPIWETETLPPLWSEILSLHDVICTPSRFAAAAFERATRRPVRVVPICLPEGPPRIRARSDGHFDFLCMFDHLSDIDRKNPLGAIDAFRAACRVLPAGTTARLRIKCHAGTPPSVLDRLREAGGDTPVDIVAQTLDDAGMEHLWRDCDCLISLHRSEGFGLPVAEALSRSIPVIATRQGGILDFADDSGCLLVSGPAAAHGAASAAYVERSGWIEPDLGEAARHILDVMSDYPAAVARAAAGRRMVLERLSPYHVRRQFDAAIGRQAAPHDATTLAGR
jgi:glycosyltransferase involved in cell wall biosynthesis